MSVDPILSATPFSPRPKKAQTVDVAAPGSAILSTYIGGSGDGYHTLSGTSMATPCVAGAVALLWSALGGVLLASPQDAGDMALLSATRERWLEGRVRVGMLSLRGMVETAELRAWLRLGAPAGGAASAAGISAQVRLPALSSVLAPLLLGRDRMAVGTYTARVLVSSRRCSSGGLADSAGVDVTYRLVGLVRLALSAGPVDWGPVPLGKEAEQTLRVENVGNGTARLLLDALPPPFYGPRRELAVAPGGVLEIALTCAPTLGLQTATATLRTNAGLTAVVAAEPGAVDAGEVHSVELRCRGQEAPTLELQRFSGVVLRSPGRATTHLEPSIPSEWEALLLDEAAPGANVTARLVAAAAANTHGCLAHEPGRAQGRVLLVRRGWCTFQLKAQLAQDAGALGLLLYDNLARTTLRMLGAEDPASQPSIPTFMVPSAQGQRLLERLEAGEVLSLSLVRRPLVLFTHQPATGNLRFAAGRLGLENGGLVALRWSAAVETLDFNLDSFYTAVYSGAPNVTTSLGMAPLQPAPAYSWTPAAGIAPLAAFAYGADDAAERVELPFAFPFFGGLAEEMHVSSNGLLVFDPTLLPLIIIIVINMCTTIYVYIISVIYIYIYI